MNKKPNVIYIYADDLGKGMLSCYGQKQFQTPNIDRIANQGMKFHQAYGCAVCAPSRASLITGYHDCHVGKWSYNKGGAYEEFYHHEMTLEDVYEIVNNSCYEYLDSEQFLPKVFKEAGYVTGQVGKLEWGFATSQKDIDSHGWDYHYGYYDHRVCHGYYPPMLFENGKIVYIEGNEHPDCGKTYNCESPENAKNRHNMDGKVVYSQDLFNEKITEFIDQNHDKPFFLFHPSQLPHGPISVPEIHEGVKDNDSLTEFEKEYASMILRLDDTVGIIYNLLDKYDLVDNTIILFSSDNGHEVYYIQEGRTDAHANFNTREKFDQDEHPFTTEEAGDIFNGNAGMVGKKFGSLDGGIRIPYLVSWPAQIGCGSESSHMVANYDLLATFCELFNVKLQPGKDGISFLNELLGQEQDNHNFVVCAGNQGPAIIMPDGYKLRYINTSKRFRLYNLNSELGELEDLSELMPVKTKMMAMKLLKACDSNFANGTMQQHTAYYLSNHI